MRVHRKCAISCSFSRGTWQVGLIGKKYGDGYFRGLTTQGSVLPPWQPPNCAGGLAGSKIFRRTRIILQQIGCRIPFFAQTNCQPFSIKYIMTGGGDFYQTFIGKIFMENITRMKIQDRQWRAEDLQQSLHWQPLCRTLNIAFFENVIMTAATIVDTVAMLIVIFESLKVDSLTSMSLDQFNKGIPG